MNGQTVAAIDNAKYLGVTFTTKLKWGTHIASISGVANRMLGFLWRNLKNCPKPLKEKAYKAYVRPKVEYSCSVWDPYQNKYISKLEMVQHRAARFVNNTPHRYTDCEDQASVTEMVEQLGWRPLVERRRNNRLVLIYRIYNNQVEVPASYHPTLRDFQPARGNQRNFTPLTPTVDAYKFAFLCRTIVDWNQLDQAIVESQSLDQFKIHLY